MKVLLNLVLVILCSCSSSRPSRSIASLPERVLDLDLQKSDVQIFPAVASEDGLWYYFYLRLKNKNGVWIECEQNDVVLKTSQGKELTFKFERLHPGRFYLTLEKTADIDSSQIDFFVSGKPLKEKLKLHIKIPDKDKSKITILSNENNRAIFQLRLADKSGRPVEILDKPEIIMDGTGEIEDIKKIKDGEWRFSLIYPDENQIMYLSVRAQGAYLQKLFRFQHVEK